MDSEIANKLNNYLERNCKSHIELNKIFLSWQTEIVSINLCFIYNFEEIFLQCRQLKQYHLFYRIHRGIWLIVLSFYHFIFYYILF